MGNLFSGPNHQQNPAPSPKPKLPISRCTLVIVDPQNDFHPGGSLGVPGANEDSARIAEMIRRYADEIDEIYVTLDSHHRTHIAHGIFWTNDAGERPAPFTLIHYNDVLNGKWKPVNEKYREHCLRYTKALADKSKFTLCIWPEHCIIGTPGHNIVQVLNEALHFWIERTNKQVHYIMKGQNCLTEMYSAIKAEYQMEDDPKTQPDPQLRAELLNSGKLLVCGQALSHCVNSTFTDIMDSFPADKRKNMILLTDGASSVPGFEANGNEFVSRITAAGCQTSTTTTVFAGGAGANQV